MIALRRFPILASLLASSAFGWVDSGHMVIADIAYQRLTPKAKTEADRLLKIGGTARTNDFLTAACWADDIRRDRPETGPWHYIDIHFREDGAPSTNKPDAENVVWAIHKFEAVLADRSKPDADRADALRFLLHFIGDIHQPLHATARDTVAHPDGDKGGNAFPIQNPFQYAAANARPPHNLHALWDLAVGQLPSLYGNFRPLNDAGRAEIDQIARYIEKVDPPSKLPKVNDLRPEDWAQESFIAAKTVVYTLPEGSKPSEEYLAKGQEVASERLALAGYRLAEVLNRILK
jgi:hypothetical protein